MKNPLGVSPSKGFVAKQSQLLEVLAFKIIIRLFILSLMFSFTSGRLVIEKFHFKRKNLLYRCGGVKRFYFQERFPADSITGN